MIDHFALFLPHLLLAIAAMRLVYNDAIDADPAGADEPGEDLVEPSRKAPRRR